MSISLLISALLVGLMGGLHCVTMCGGFVAAAATRDASLPHGTEPLLPRKLLARRQLHYHAGRLATYMLLGTVFGAAGSAALNFGALVPLQRALYVVANGMLLVLGLSLVVGTPWTPVLQRGGARVFGVMVGALGPLLRRPGIIGRLALGMTWGLVPCALVYSVLPLALFSGGAAQGGIVMLAFGIGTIPNLMAAGALIGSAKRWLKVPTLRNVAAAVLCGFAVLGLLRVLASPDSSLAGPFCLGPF